MSTFRVKEPVHVTTGHGDFDFPEGDVAAETAGHEHALDHLVGTGHAAVLHRHPTQRDLADEEAAKAADAERLEAEEAAALAAEAQRLERAAAEGVLTEETT